MNSRHPLATDDPVVDPVTGLWFSRRETQCNVWFDAPRLREPLYIDRLVFHHPPYWSINHWIRMTCGSDARLDALADRVIVVGDYTGLDALFCYLRTLPMTGVLYNAREHEMTCQCIGSLLRAGHEKMAADAFAV